MHCFNTNINSSEISVREVADIKYFSTGGRRVNAAGKLRSFFGGGGGLRLKKAQELHLLLTPYTAVF
jgi:hypothetical protein